MHIDHVRSSSLTPRRFAGMCVVCDGVRDMILSWKSSTIASNGVVAPDWHGAVTCGECDLPSNVRAVSQLLIDRGRENVAVVAHGLTSSALTRLSDRIPALRDGLPSEQGLADCVIAVDTVEHSADWRAELDRLRGTVRDGGMLVLTTRFDSTLESTVDLAGARTGTPVRRMGWDLIEALRGSGFREVSAHLYWAPWQGHLGVTSFVFEALA